MPQLQAVPQPAEPKRVSFANIIAALSFALDLTEGACPGHAVRTCILGMQIAREAGLTDDLLCGAYYALLLKDVGCSSNSGRLYQIVGDDEIRAKRLTRIVDWTRTDVRQIHYLLKHAHSHESGLRRLRKLHDMVRNSSHNAELLIRLRCEQGSKVLLDLGLGPAASEAVYCLDEHWDGSGYPDRLSGDRIPILARLASISQTLEVFHRLYGPAAALDVIRQRSGHWFDPSLVRAVVSLNRRGILWDHLDESNPTAFITTLEPCPQATHRGTSAIDNLCAAFGGVVDAKSHYTFTHSTGVARVAARLGECLNLPEREITILRRAGLLHDIGKLSVPNSILDKQGTLTPAEWDCIRMHPHYTFEILNRIDGFEEIAEVAANHHEKLDGTGYHRGLRGDDLNVMSRVLAVADRFDALSGERPYRSMLSVDQVMAILKKESPHAIDATCLAALEGIAEAVAPTEDLYALA